MTRRHAVITALFLGAQILDILTTLVGFGYGMVEVNPVFVGMPFPMVVLLKLAIASTIPIGLIALVPERQAIWAMRWAAVLSTVAPVLNAVKIARVM